MKYTLLILVVVALACLAHAVKRDREDIDDIKDVTDGANTPHEQPPVKRPAERPMNPLAKVHPEDAVGNLLFFAGEASRLPPRVYTDAERVHISRAKAASFFATTVPRFRAQATLELKSLRALYFFMLVGIMDEPDRVTVTWRNGPFSHEHAYPRAPGVDAIRRANNYGLYIAETLARNGAPRADPDAHKTIVDWKTTTTADGLVMYEWTEVDSQGRTKVMRSLPRHSGYEWDGMSQVFDAIKGKTIMVNV